MRTGSCIVIALLIATVACQGPANLTGSWVFPWQYSGFNASTECYPSAVVIATNNHGDPNQLDITYTFSSAAYSSATCQYFKINASTINSTITGDGHSNYFYDDNFPFDYQSLAQIGTLGVRVSGGIYFQFSMVPSNNVGPNEAAYAAALTGSFGTVINGTVQSYFWHSRNGSAVNASTCCIPNTIGITINPNNVSFINATINFSNVTANPWCAAGNFTSGTVVLTGFIEQVSTTYNVTAWGADFDTNQFGNAYDFIFFYDNSTLRVGYSVNNDVSQGACGFDIDTSAVTIA